MPGEAAETTRVASSGEPSQSTTQPSRTAVRDGLADHALARRQRSDAVATPLDDFLSEPDPGIALQLWFGAHPCLTDAGSGGIDRRRLTAAIDRDIAQIDQLMSDQVDAVLHNPRFQALEAAWRGVVYLVGQAQGDDRVAIRLLDVSWAELARDLERAMEFDQSQLWAKVYSAEFGMPGGEPYGILLGVYEIQHRRGPGHPTDDVATLDSLAQVAAASFAPFVVGMAPAMLGLDDFSRLGVPFDLEGVFRQPEYARWQSLREKPDARFLGITLPRVLMRCPYEDHGRRRDGFRYRECVEGPDLSRFLWAPATFAFGGVVIRAFRQFRWFADIRGAPLDMLGGGLVSDLPIHTFATEPHGVAARFPTDVSVSERQEMQLSELGFMPLCAIKNTELAVFYSNASVQRPQRYDRAEATANARLSSMLQYMLCVSRFSHYIKVMTRDRIGSFKTADECQNYLSRWLISYVTRNENLPMEQLAAYPLRNAQIQVRELPGKPGEYFATIHLQPHFQLDQVETGLKLVTELSGPKAA